jgi:hypothetical protein
MVCLLYVITFQTFLFRYHKLYKKSNPKFLLRYEVYRLRILSQQQQFTLKAVLAKLEKDRHQGRS